LPGRGLQGPISPALGDLTGLRRLNLSHNSLSGELPLERLLKSSSPSGLVAIDVSFNRLEGELRELPSSNSGWPLQVLNISSNQFTGEFPSATWQAMDDLVVLNASNNSFHGRMPTSFCISSSSSFAMLDLCYNQFSGRIPAGLGNCSELRVLRAGHNRFSGALPDELFNASSLEHLSLPNNGLYGKLGAARIANLRNLAHLDLGGNELDGKIPDSIGELRGLEVLRLDHNNMSGELPPALSNCTNLMTVDLKNNYFSGELTRIEFSALTNLKTLDLLFNGFTGTIPESIFSCSNLSALRLADNKLHGQISPGIVNLKSLVFLSLAFNNFTNITNTLHVLKDCKNLTILLTNSNYKGEAMPEDEAIEGFQNLRILSLARCSLSGKIPLWLSKLKNLNVLFLQNNQLSGPIPAWMKSLKSLFHLDISYNKLAGEIPTALMEMPMLTAENTAIHLDRSIFLLIVYRGTSFEYRTISGFPNMLNLGYNNFTGAIPKEIGQLKSLTILNLSSNSLSGVIPVQLCSLENLQVLDLSNNLLTGAIPSDLNNLHFLSTINVSNNDLEGPIPRGGQFSTFTNSSFQGNPKLCGNTIDRPCGSAQAPLVSALTTEQRDRRIAFVIAFCAFFGVGVLYDQIVLSKYFGQV
jgi:Leucine-rich repeat (LRR) protein